MITQPAEYLTPLEGIIGRWRSAGSVLDEDGSTVVATISGTDVYSWASSGNWIVHDVDVLMGDERTLVTELIGGRDAESDGWQMHAFDKSESPGADESHPTKRWHVLAARPGSAQLAQYRGWPRAHDYSLGARNRAREVGAVDGHAL